MHGLTSIQFYLTRKKYLELFLNVTWFQKKQINWALPKEQTHEGKCGFAFTNEMRKLSNSVPS